MPYGSITQFTYAQTPYLAIIFFYLFNTFICFVL